MCQAKKRGKNQQEILEFELKINCEMENSYVQLRVDDIDEAAQHNDKIKSIPRVAEVILHKILKLHSFICFTPLF